MNTGGLSITSRILFCIHENNEYGALLAAQEQIRDGMPGFLGGEVKEWKYYLVRFLTLMGSLISQQDNSASFMDREARTLLMRIDTCSTSEECCDMFKEIIHTGCAINEEIGGSCSALVRRVKEHVATDLTRPLTLHYFAELLNVNSSYLSNLFRRQAGMTLTEYVTQKRISHAATLLANTNLPVKQVARLSGVPDVQYFSRLFKRRMGVTPSEYRDTDGREKRRKLLELASEKESIYAQ